jgi:hypothetical protein
VVFVADRCYQPLVMATALKLESTRVLMEAALAGKSCEELRGMHADLARAEQQSLAGIQVGDPAGCEAVSGQIETSREEDPQASSFDAEGQYVATDEDIPF